MIDLRSDTVTKPTEEMRKAMCVGVVIPLDYMREVKALADHALQVISEVAAGR